MRALLGVAALMLGACVSTKAPAPASLMGSQLVGTQLVGTQWGPENGLGQFIFLEPGGLVSGFGGCNAFSGTYRQSGSSLVFGPLRATKKGCDLSGAEAAFFDGLANAARYEFRGEDMLILREDGTLVLNFRRRA